MATPTPIEEPTASPNAPSPSTTSTPGTNDNSSPRGPLGTLIHRLSETPLAHHATDNIPSSARPLLSRTAQPARRAIHAVDQTLTTDEARRVASSVHDLAHAVVAFTLMLFATGVTTLERTLNIPTNPSPSPSTTTTTATSPNTDTDNQNDRDESNGLNDADTHPSHQATSLTGDAHRARLILQRYVIVLRTVLERASHNMSGTRDQESTTDNDNGSASEAAPRQTEDTLKTGAKRAVKFASQLGAYSLGYASQWSGTGAGTIAPAAEYIITNLPAGAQQAVRNSRSPLDGSPVQRHNAAATGARTGSDDVNVD